MRAFLIALLISVFLSASVWAKDPVVIGSKNFTEQYILGELLALTIEKNTDIPVQRQFNLGGTQFAFEAIRTGDIDMYPEYTGTALLSLLKEELMADPDRVFNLVKNRYEQNYDLTWAKPFGFNNTYVFAVRNDDTALTDIKTVSQLANMPDGPKILIAVNHEFMDRPDGFYYVKRKYNLPIVQANVVNLDTGLMYTAIRDQRVDAIVAFSTDGRIKAFNLRTLKDDLRVFPPYEPAAVIRKDTLKKYPELVEVLDKLSGVITDEEMMQMNYEVDHLDQAPKQVAARFLVEKGIIPANSVKNADVATDNFWLYAWAKREYLLRLLKEHIMLTIAALALAIGISLPLGVLLTRLSYLEGPVFAVVNLLQTIPSLALLGFLIPFLGIGVKPAIVALFLYALLPLVRNTFTGIKEVDPNLKEACRGMGLTDMQILKKVELPLALPTIMAGVRTSTVIIVGTATLVALIGAGGLGDPIFRGISSVNSNTILLGAVPAALLAIVLDRLLHILEGRITPGQAGTKVS